MPTSGQSPHAGEALILTFFSSTVLLSSCMQAQSVRIVGAGVPVSSASSTTATIKASTSVGLPASTSCSVDGLWGPTLAAPRILLSIVTSNISPKLLAIAEASSIAARTTATEGGNVAMTSSVECVIAPMGLKHKFPSSFTHMLERIESRIGALKPAATRAALKRWTRSELHPSSSPRGSSVPSVCWTSPGARKCAAGYGMQPTMRPASMARRMRPPGSTDSRGRPSKGPPCFKKYHHGSPFCIESTMVLAWKSIGSSSKMGKIWWAFSATMTTSTVPTSATEPTARTGTSSSTPSTPTTTMPCRRCIAAKWSLRATSVTRSPARASQAPTSPPMAPAPTTHQERGCRSAEQVLMDGAKAEAEAEAEPAAAPPAAAAAATAAAAAAAARARRGG
mmetsp:Transcript_8017/g.22253  ORF Transcript_8017/g.22253 Transcript_8017/m.22253 type:complete len:394 (+) Transcript_8017:56-1237(+)